MGVRNDVQKIAGTSGPTQTHRALIHDESEPSTDADLAEGGQASHVESQTASSSQLAGAIAGQHPPSENERAIPALSLSDRPAGGVPRLNSIHWHATAP
jgi:hypothetical protein